MARKRGRPRKKRGPGRTTPDVTYEERLQIKILLRAGHTPREIASLINRSRSCVYLEIMRGRCSQIEKGMPVVRYEPETAQRSHDIAQSRKGRDLKIASDHETMNALDRLVIDGHYSPYAAIEVARARGELKTSISTTTYYRYIHKGVSRVEEKHLRYGFEPRKKDDKEAFNKRPAHLKSRTGGESIAKRPKHILSRNEFGHWEGDLIVSARGGRAAVLTLVERKTRKLITEKVDDRAQATILAAFDRIEKRVGAGFSDAFKSITFDNGAEFLDAVGIQHSCIDLHDPGGTRVKSVYYAHPFCSSERGSNENINGFLRRVFPKGTIFDAVPAERLAQATSWINSYPRRLFKGSNADALFERELALIEAEKTA